MLPGVPWGSSTRSPSIRRSPVVTLGSYLENTFIFEDLQVPVPLNVRRYFILATASVVLLTVSLAFFLPSPEQVRDWAVAGPLFAGLLELLLPARQAIELGCLAYLVVALGLACWTRMLAVASVHQLRLAYGLFVVGALAASIDLLVLAILASATIALFAVVATIVGLVLVGARYLGRRR